MRTLRDPIRAFVIVSLALMFSLFATAGAVGAALDQHRRDPVRQEEKLSKQIRHELLMLPYYSVFDNLAYKIQGDHVTLLGQVVRPTLKSDAEQVVKRIEGVAEVTNHIEVLPLSSFDDRIRRAEYRVIYGSSQLSLYALDPNPPIHIIVKNGHVTLVGVVENEGDRDIAGIQAGTVPNVFSITNDLVVVKS